MAIIPPATEPLIIPKTGRMTNSWYRYFQQRNTETALIKVVAGSIPANSPTFDLVLPTTIGSRGVQLELSGVCPTAISATMNMLFSNDKGATFITSSSYTYSHLSIDQGGTLNPTGSVGTSTALIIEDVISVAPSGGMNLNMQILNPNDQSFWPRITWLGSFVASGGMQTSVGSGFLQITDNVNALRLKFVSGNIAQGKYALYAWL